MAHLENKDSEGYFTPGEMEAYFILVLVYRVLNEKGDSLLKNRRTNLNMVIFGEVYAVRLWFGWNWSGGSALRRELGNNAALGAREATFSNLPDAWRSPAIPS